MAIIRRFSNILPNGQEQQNLPQYSQNRALQPSVQIGTQPIIQQYGHSGGIKQPVKNYGTYSNPSAPQQRYSGLVNYLKNYK